LKKKKELSVITHSAEENQKMEKRNIELEIATNSLQKEAKLMYTYNGEEIRVREKKELPFVLLAAGFAIV
jgi:hypothetical protein